ncbi:hypothetical protein, partial [Glaesserella parasuis]|uniref:hypothetical protein n=1 Tax=Glaesserella parasuis TaxID=738 RepID=UPI0019D6C2A1
MRNLQRFYRKMNVFNEKNKIFYRKCRATTYVVHFSTYMPSNSSSRNSSDQPAAVNFPFILC